VSVILPIDYSLVCAALSPAMCASLDRLPYPYTTAETRYRRKLNLSLLRPFLPPANEVQSACLAWVMSDSGTVHGDVLCAGIMMQSVALRKLVVASPVRKQWVERIGMERLVAALRYEDESATPFPAWCEEQHLHAIGFAVMYRYLRTSCVELSRRLLRRMAKDDPRLRQCIACIREMRGRSCAPIGTIVIENFKRQREART
jgi:hypothetical protein